jgi:hypothetical protein
MKKLLFAALIFLFQQTLNFAQTVDDIMINPFWSFYSDNYLDAVSSGKGGTGIGANGNISSINRNPASLNLPGKYQADVQYVYKTRLQWLPSLGFNDLYLKQNPFSGSAGFGWKFSKEFQSGFLYSNPASMTLNVGEIIMTNEFGEEIGRFEGYDKYIIHSFSVPLVYNFGGFRFGVNLNYSFHRRYFKTNPTEEYVGKFDRFNIQAGVLFTPIKELSIGATITPESKGKVSNSIGTFEETAIIPLKAGAGFEYTFKGNFLRFSGDFIYRNTSARENLKDQIQVHMGLEYRLKKQLAIRGGFIVMQDPRKLPGNYSNPNDSYSQIFLTAGGTLKLKNTEISLGIMDSHVSSGEIKNTYINGGVTFNF